MPSTLNLLEPPVAGEKGTMWLRDELTDRTPRTGDMTALDHGLRRDG